jgi:hypothetical protein
VRRAEFAAALRALLALFALACSAGEPPEDEPAAAAPTEAPQPPDPTLRATLVLEPPRIEIGDVFEVEVAVVTPPGYRVAPAQVPKAVPGIAIMDAALPSVSQEPGRWVHRQRFRARARATGPFRWPALELDVEGPGGERGRVVAAERPFEVVSLLAEQPERRSPFSFRSPRLEDAPGRGPWLPALFGSLMTLAALGLLSLVRRVRSAEAHAGAGAPAAGADDEGSAEVLAALHAAEAEEDAVHGADLASEALRAWAAERFLAPRLRSATTEELAGLAPPFLLTTRWAALRTVLEALDAVRFPPRRGGARAELGRALARARALVADAGRPAP